MLLGLLLTSCGSGTDGIAVPPPMDMAHLVRPATPNTALAAPADYTPVPDIVTGVYSLPPDQLFTAAVAMAEAQPRSFVLKTYDERLQAHFVVRSAVFGFPDLVTIQVLPDGAGKSRLILWSRSVYGHSDFGVNRARVTAWLAALDAKGAVAPHDP